MGFFDCFKRKKDPEPQPQPNPQPGPPPAHLLFGYFGTQPGTVVETADHSNLVFVASWGDWSSYAGRKAIMDSVVSDLQTAAAHGVPNAFITVDFLVFGPGWGSRSEQTAIAELSEFFTRLRNANLLRMVKAIYPVDEPNLVGIDNLTMNRVNNTILTVASGFVELAEVSLAVIYTDHLNDLPGLDTFDWIGFDAYDKGAAIFTNGQYDTLKSKLRADQRTLLVPGGASPWRTDPVPFYNKAVADSQVIAIVPFIWFDGWGSDPTHLGIKGNGMAPAYQRIGRAIKTGTAPV